MSEASGKFLSIGMPGDDCCFCGPVIVKRSGEPTTDPPPPECAGHCTEALPLHGEPGGNPPDFCFPYTCCPCSSGGTVTASLVVTSPSSGGVSKDLELSSSESGMCIAHPVMCYADTGPYYNSRVPAEKYGVQNVELCAPVGGCSGQRISASLCCCENSDAMGPTRGTGDCHTCNYQFTIYWLPLDTLGSPYCFCPTGGLEPPTHLLPGEGYVPAGLGYIYDRFELVDSTCDPFYLYYEATGQYWNCDCLQAGDREDIDNTVTLAVTITR